MSPDPTTYSTADERRGFETAIAADPHEATSRLAYADWLEEHGDDPNEAAFQRSMAEWVARRPHPTTLVGDRDPYDVHTHPVAVPGGLGDATHLPVGVGAVPFHWRREADAFSATGAPLPGPVNDQPGLPNYPPDGMPRTHPHAPHEATQHNPSGLREGPGVPHLAWRSWGHMEQAFRQGFDPWTSGGPYDHPPAPAHPDDVDHNTPETSGGLIGQGYGADNPPTHYADYADVANLLAQLASPDHHHTRWGTPEGDRTFRQAVADAMRDVGREGEADLLQQPGHVMVHEERVRPARHTPEPALAAARVAANHMAEQGVVDGDMWDPDLSHIRVATTPGRHDWTVLDEFNGEESHVAPPEFPAWLADYTQRVLDPTQEDLDADDPEEGAEMRAFYAPHLRAIAAAPHEEPDPERDSPRHHPDAPPPPEQDAAVSAPTNYDHASGVPLARNLAAQHDDHTGHLVFADWLDENHPEVAPLTARVRDWASAGVPGYFGPLSAGLARVGRVGPFAVSAAHPFIDPTDPSLGHDVGAVDVQFHPQLGGPNVPSLGGSMSGGLQNADPRFDRDPAWAAHGTWMKPVGYRVRLPFLDARRLLGHEMGMDDEGAPNDAPEPAEAYSREPLETWKAGAPVAYGAPRGPQYPWHPTHNPGGHTDHSPDESMLVWNGGGSYSDRLTWPPDQMGREAGWGGANEVTHLVPVVTSEGRAFWMPSNQGVQRRVSDDTLKALLAHQMETWGHPEYAEWHPHTNHLDDFTMGRHIMRELTPSELARHGLWPGAPSWGQDPDDWQSHEVFADFLEEQGHGSDPDAFRGGWANHHRGVAERIRARLEHQRQVETGPPREGMNDPPEPTPRNLVGNPSTFASEGTFVSYGADLSQVANLLAQLAAEENAADRWGEVPNSNLRGVLADALQDNRRDQEAEWVRSGRHVLVTPEGAVRPGRFDHNPAQAAMWDLGDFLSHHDQEDPADTIRLDHRGDAYDPSDFVDPHEHDPDFMEGPEMSLPPNHIRVVQGPGLPLVANDVHRSALGRHLAEVIREGVESQHPHPLEPYGPEAVEAFHGLLQDLHDAPTEEEDQTAAGPTPAARYDMGDTDTSESWADHAGDAPDRDYWRHKIPYDAVHYDDHATVDRLLAHLAQTGTNDATLHGALADALDETHPDTPWAGLLRRQFGLGEHAAVGPCPNQHYLETNEWQHDANSTNPWLSGLNEALWSGTKGPFDVFLRHEGETTHDGDWFHTGWEHASNGMPEDTYPGLPTGIDLREFRRGMDEFHNGKPPPPTWVLHAVSNRPDSREFGYSFEFPPERMDELKAIMPEHAGVGFFDHPTQDHYHVAMQSQHNQRRRNDHPLQVRLAQQRAQRLTRPPEEGMRGTHVLPELQWDDDPPTPAARYDADAAPVNYALTPGDLHPRLRHTRLGALLLRHANTSTDEAAALAREIALSDPHETYIDNTKVGALQDWLGENPGHPLAQSFRDGGGSLLNSFTLDQLAHQEISKFAAAAYNEHGGPSHTTIADIMRRHGSEGSGGGVHVEDQVADAIQRRSGGVPPVELWRSLVRLHRQAVHADSDQGYDARAAADPFGADAVREQQANAHRTEHEEMLDPAWGHPDSPHSYEEGGGDETDYAHARPKPPGWADLPGFVAHPKTDAAPPRPLPAVAYAADSAPTDYSHEAFHQAIRDNPDDATARAVYADWLEEHAPEHAPPHVLNFLRHHRGPAWVAFSPDGRELTPGGHPRLVVGPHLSWGDLDRANQGRYGPGEYRFEYGGDWSPAGGGEHFGFFPTFVNTTNPDAAELEPVGSPQSGPGGHYFVTRDTPGYGGEPSTMAYVWQFNPASGGISSVHPVAEDPLGDPDWMDWAHRSAAEHAAGTRTPHRTPPGADDESQHPWFRQDAPPPEENATDAVPTAYAADPALDAAGADRARRVDLVVLPDGVAGTNCGNCRYFRNNHCGNVEVDLPVSEHMCCALWDAAGTEHVGRTSYAEEDAPVPYAGDSRFSRPQDPPGFRRPVYTSAFGGYHLHYLEPRAVPGGGAVWVPAEGQPHTLRDQGELWGRVRADWPRFEGWSWEGGTGSYDHELGHSPYFEPLDEHDLAEWQTWNDPTARQLYAHLRGVPNDANARNALADRLAELGHDGLAAGHRKTAQIFQQQSRPPHDHPRPDEAAPPPDDGAQYPDSHDAFGNQYARVDYGSDQERLGFESAIQDNPWDGTAHGAYADWLEEQGHHEEAQVRRWFGRYLSGFGGGNEALEEWKQRHGDRALETLWNLYLGVHRDVQRAHGPQKDADEHDGVHYAARPAHDAIHPELRNTRLGAYLREVAAQDSDVGAHARALLASDPAAPLDETALLSFIDHIHEADHPLVNAFNWGTLPRSLAADRALRGELGIPRLGARGPHGSPFMLEVADVAAGRRSEDRYPEGAHSAWVLGQSGMAPQEIADSAHRAFGQNVRAAGSPNPEEVHQGWFDDDLTDEARGGQPGGVHRYDEEADEPTDYGRTDYSDADEQAGFEHTVDENPLDSNTHAVYADWLQDRGHDDEAAFRRSLAEWVRTRPPEYRVHPEFGPDVRPWFVRGHFDEGVYPAGVRGVTSNIYGTLVNRLGRNLGTPAEHHGVWEVGPPAEPEFGVSWRTYRDMEAALRDSFHAGRAEAHRDDPPSSLDLRTSREWGRDADPDAPINAARYDRVDYGLHDDLRQFMTQLGRDPDDATARAVFADWLEENAPHLASRRTLDFLRGHEGRGWVRLLDDNRRAVIWPEGRLFAGPATTRRDIEQQFGHRPYLGAPVSETLIGHVPLDDTLEHGPGGSFWGSIPLHGAPRLNVWGLRGGGLSMWDQIQPGPDERFQVHERTNQRASFLPWNDPEQDDLPASEHYAARYAAEDWGPPAEGAGWGEHTDDPERALHAAIATNPLEATNHAVLADWYDEQGDPEQADFRRRLAAWVGRGLPQGPPNDDHPTRPWSAFTGPGPHLHPQGMDLWGNLGTLSPGSPVATTSRLPVHETWPPDALGNRNHLLRWRSWNDLEDSLWHAFRRGQGDTTETTAAMPLIPGVRRPTPADDPEPPAEYAWHGVGRPDERVPVRPDLTGRKRFDAPAFTAYGWEGAPTHYDTESTMRPTHYHSDADVQAMLRAIPPRAWRGGDPSNPRGPNMTPRLAAADMLDEQGRHREAAILRDTRRFAYVQPGGTVHDAGELTRLLHNAPDDQVRSVPDGPPPIASQLPNFPSVAHYLQGALEIASSPTGGYKNRGYQLAEVFDPENVGVFEPETMAGVVGQVNHLMGLHGVPHAHLQQLAMVREDPSWDVDDQYAPPEHHADLLRLAKRFGPVALRHDHSQDVAKGRIRAHDFGPLPGFDDAPPDESVPA